MIHFSSVPYRLFLKFLSAGGCRLTTAEVNISKFRIMVFGVYKGFVVIKWCVQHTAVARLRRVLIKGF